MTNLTGPVLMFEPFAVKFLSEADLRGVGRVRVPVERSVPRPIDMMGDIAGGEFPLIGARFARQGGRRIGDWAGMELATTEVINDSYSAAVDAVNSATSHAQRNHVWSRQHLAPFVARLAESIRDRIHEITRDRG
jgi:hypothetical protein